MQAVESGCYIVYESQGHENGMKKVLKNTQWDELTRTFTGTVTFDGAGGIDYKFIFSTDYSEI
jgi:hypothetical protein